MAAKNVTVIPATISQRTRKATEDGTRLCEDIEKVYGMPGGKQRFWDQVAFDYCPGHYKITVRPCTFSDIIEIDTFNELKQLDPNYAM